tara:strand:- start:200 stop:466 length:267 start_codon:yes stop_codon:yes gene_type:complete
MKTPINPVIVEMTDQIDAHVPGALEKMREFIDTKILLTKCVNCEQLTDPTTFKNKTDAIEYSISGLCEKCQLDFFGPTTTPIKQKGNI